MRTIIELPKELAKSLDLYRKSKGISRTEAIRRAIQQYLEQLTEPASDEAFGLWKGKVGDGLRYERSVRGEWGGVARLRRHLRHGDLIAVTKPLNNT